MTTVIPVPALPTMDLEITADPAAISAFGDDLLTSSATFDDVATFVASDATPEGWTGPAASSYRSSLQQPQSDLQAMSLSLRRTARAVDSYQREMSRCLWERQDLVESLRFLGHSREQLLADINAAREATPAEVADLQDRARTLRNAINEWSADLVRLKGDVDRADRAMIQAFESQRSMEQVRRSFAGKADPADALLFGPGSPLLNPFFGPEDARAWWAGLSAAQRQALIAAYPEVIGGLDGVPASARNEANRVRLGQDLDLLRMRERDGTLTGDEEAILRNAEATEAALERADGHVDPVTREPVPGQLYIYEPGAFDGDGRVAISVGDLDSADDVAVQVPGFGNDATSAPSMTDRMGRIYDASRFDSPDSSTAVMTWIGYDSPDNVPFKDGWGADAAGVLKEDMAQAGGDLLATDMDGLQSARDIDPHLTIIGHSYGSTTVGISAHDHGLPADDIVLVGSPGAGGDTNNAGDMNIDPDHVYVGRASRDIIATLGNHGWVHGETLFGAGLGDDPAEDDFGAHRFQAEDVDRTGSHRGFADHGRYFDHDTESLYNISQVVNGDYDDVLSAEHVYDPWYEGPQDPEWDREPTVRDTTAH